MSKLYPLTFHTIYKDKIWGGRKIKTILGKDYGALPNCGETWEISGVPGNVSVVKSGELQGQDLVTLLETYKDRLVGKKVYQKYGNSFPLLIKFLDANDDLSIQVHPDDALAKERHNSFGKTEMWYILQADEGAQLNTGFNKTIDQKTYIEHLNSGRINEILNFETVSAGDVYFLPAGRVHYIGKGICLAEIQQSSDITYRIYDFNRVDNQGNKRELHTAQALAALDFNFHKDYKTEYISKVNEPVGLVACLYFTTNLLKLTEKASKDYSQIDSFVIYICLEGSLSVSYYGEKLIIKMGECLLLPAENKQIELQPHPVASLLEVFISD